MAEDNDKVIQTFFKEDKFEQRITFPRKVKSKSKINLSHIIQNDRR